MGAAYSFIGIEVLSMYFTVQYNIYILILYYVYIDGVNRDGEYAVLSHKRVQDGNKYKNINR